eukprot:707243-Ditylum_brightwellii.AAC.1
MAVCCLIAMLSAQTLDEMVTTADLHCTKWSLAFRLALQNVHLSETSLSYLCNSKFVGRRSL